jgi:serine/threonine protein kinase/tetratricopeptide (TPR) repeat protein/TolB-like protein
MTTENWAQLKTVFSHAAGLAPEKRAAYLDEACAGKPDLRAEVERLLAADPEPETVDTSRIQRVLAEGVVVADRFRIVRFVAAGGMGEVYEAEDLRLSGRVALKTLKPDLEANAPFLARFRREVQLARQVTHRNICRIFDVGHDELDGRHLEFLTMEYVEGVTLASYIKQRGRFSAPAALPLVKQMASGLTALHESQIVHRDFKPGNVMIADSPSGTFRIVITDFGLARAHLDGPAEPDVTASTGLSRTGQFLGTPQYMAPEQLTGRPVSPATDIYALGLVMYEMVTGSKPYGRASGLESAVRRLTEPLPAPRKAAADLPAQWEEAIYHCLEREPSERPATPAAVVAGLEGDVTLTRVQRLEPKSGRSRPIWQWAAAAATILILLALTVAVLRLTDHTKEEAVALHGQQHVAVLPFRVIGEDEGLRPFADGLMETITSRLSQFEGSDSTLLVVPSSEIRRQRAESARDADRLFGVDYAVEGSLQAEGDRVRLLLSVIETDSLKQVDSAVVDELRSNSFNLQDGAVTRLSGMLSLSVDPGNVRDLASLSPAAPGAYEFYVQGRGYLQRNDQVRNIDSAVQVFDEALSLDPDYALAHSGLCEAYWYKYQLTKELDWTERALKACNTSVGLNDQLPEVHVTLGRVHSGTGKYNQAIDDYERALDLAPRNGEAFTGLAGTYALLEQYDKAEATHQTAIRLRMSDWRAFKQFGLYYFSRGRYAEAAAQFERVVKLTPDNAQGYSNLGAAFYYAGDLDSARMNWEKSVAIEPRHSALSNLGKLYSDQGNDGLAAERYNQALELDPKNFRLWGNLASAYSRLGDGRAPATYDEGLALIHDNLSVNPAREELYSYLAQYSLGAGRRADAERWIDRAVRHETKHQAELIRNADTLEQLGRREDALQMVGRAFEAGAPASTVERSKPLMGLIQDPRYQEMRRDYLGAEDKD